MRGLGAGDLLFLLTATGWTLALTTGSFLFGGLVGVAIALCRVSHHRVLRLVAAGYIGLFQGTPLLLQLFLVYFGSILIGFDLGPYVSAILGLSLNAGAFLGEIWRSALQAVPDGQAEAARALGLSYLPRMARVVGPQALRIAIPPTVGYLVNLVKSTSLAAVIGFVELTRAGQMINNATFQPFKVFGIVAAMYFVICWQLTLLSRRLEVQLALAYRR